MTDQYDDADDDSYDDTEQAGRNYDGTPSYGTASRGNPVTSEAAYPPETDDPIVTINPENQPPRTYALTERVKQYYEDAVSSNLDRLDVSHYDMWWQDTTLHVEYEGCVRPQSARPGSKNPSAGNQQQKQQQTQSPMAQLMQQMQQGGQQNDGPVLPREPKPPFAGRQGTVQVQMPIPDDYPDNTFFDEGLLPVSGFAEFDIQERAKMNPLGVEDVFVEPWSDDYPVQTPLSTDSDGDANGNGEMFEVEDFRDQTDAKDETLNQGQRGHRYHL